MFSTRKMKKVFEDLKKEVNEINPKGDVDGDIYELIFGEKPIQMWFDQMNIEVDIKNDMETSSIHQLVDLNDLRWYALCCKLNEQNNALRAMVDKLLSTEENKDADN